MTSPDKRPVRQWWIQKGTPDFIADSWNEAEGFCINERCELPVIHVVEHSAYRAALDELALAEKANAVLIEQIKETAKSRNEAIQRAEMAEKAAAFASGDGWNELPILRASSQLLVEALEKISQSVWRPGSLTEAETMLADIEGTADKALAAHKGEG